ncbi:MAG: hypothetical protein MUC44_09485 [Beijerinckiaceae bacterium]|nr:hypothetical protein [Beijerinckiaceae bacterium]
MRAELRPLIFGLVLALSVAVLFRLAGHLFFFEGRASANAQALAGATAGLGIGWLVGRHCCGLRGVLLAALPGLLLMAAITSHFGLAFPAIDPKLDKGFGGLMLWFHGFLLMGGLFGARHRPVAA